MDVINEPMFYMDAESLMSKWGFGDGDALTDWWWDRFDEEPPFDTDAVLAELVEVHLIPAMAAVGWAVEMVTISTIHNPVRADSLNGVDVDWYNGSVSFDPPIEVAVNRAQILTAACAIANEGKQS